MAVTVVLLVFLPHSDETWRVLPVCVASRVVVTTCRFYEVLTVNRVDESSVRPGGFVVGFWVIWLARARFDEFPLRGRCVERREPRTGFVLRVLHEGETSQQRQGARRAEEAGQ
ncbi:hypothetical protein Taro_043695 [Colocasia esculenta]|uniref:Uncharacterized protein n=1 Tax=Colocasia esculenta TaxID=4460 RepID=A0A843WS24_COLES|nr:hypothetical protein [Colocasia esculenta]